MGRPIFFTQKRPGKNEKIFTIYKFRTMNNNKDEKNNLLSDDERLSSFGHQIRKLSLDELPQLFNILKGDMSFIGPRPLLCEYLKYYNKEQAKRHLVLPGMTGLAQVNGRNAISWEEKFKFDSEYAQNISFFMDIQISLKTIKKVIQKDGIQSSSGRIMENFRG
jgi:undecaprenyl phosphate N,N'-diacetylbacillosamine 1-phosphate transferase